MWVVWAGIARGQKRRRDTSLMGTFRLYGEVFRRMRTYAGRLLLVVAALILSSIVETTKPWPLKVVIDNVLRAQPLRVRWFPPLSRSQLLLGACLALVLVYVLVGVIGIA